ncbi:MAG: CDP-diacylglycerol--glycerol-3-phosphate 3-phosphatidyltransferase [Cellvibrionales bacterium]|nr:CDP-diacylglycerol--glycerol-3-phosphate 3-phosphatidyltransferase [Cellvibrionales bacterium]
MTLPNWITVFRLVLIPFFVLFFYLPYKWSFYLSAFIFVAAALSDMLDGYLARKLNQSSEFGAFLDPVADKLIVIISVVLLIEKFHSIYFTLPALVIISREIIISALREWMSGLGLRSTVAVSMLGKLKTVAQMLSITLFLILHAEHVKGLYDIAYASFYLAAILTLWSMVVYLKAAWPVMLERG